MSKRTMYKRKHRSIKASLHNAICHNDEMLAIGNCPSDNDFELSSESHACLLSALKTYDEQCSELLEADSFNTDYLEIKLEHSCTNKKKSKCFLTEPAVWATKTHQTRDAIASLLKLLADRGHFLDGELPVDPRTIYDTPIKINAENKCGGSYVYLGLKESLLFALSAIDEKYITCLNIIRIDVNIDGLPLTKSSSNEFWPILCSLVNIKCSPFVVALYYGKKKPNSFAEYLLDFVAEINDLKINGFKIGKKIYKIHIRAFLCDALERSFIKNIQSHTVKHSCERCTVIGVHNSNRVVFLNDQCEARTDEGFRRELYTKHYSKDKVEDSPLLQISGLNIISDVALDHMHLVYLGVVRRFLHFLNMSSQAKISIAQRNIVSDRLVSYADFTPSEFVRKPRSLSKFYRWKATELRQFLIYTGVVALRGVISNELYELFLSLSLGVSILCSGGDLRNALLNYARDLLKVFVRNASLLFGCSFVSYNVHSLIHLPDECEHL